MNIKSIMRIINDFSMGVNFSIDILLSIAAFIFFLSDRYLLFFACIFLVGVSNVFRFKYLDRRFQK